MNRIGVFYATTSGNTENVAVALAKALGEDKVDLHDIAQSGFAGIEDYKLAIFGISTWNGGNLQADWEAHWDELGAIDFEDVCIALFGVGDQYGYSFTYLEALAKLHGKLRSLGARIIGHWPAEGYNFRHSNAFLTESNAFVGLALDEESQGGLTSKRVARWAAQIQVEFEADQQARGGNLARYLLEAYHHPEKVLYFYGDKKIRRIDLQRQVSALASMLQTVLVPGDRAIIALNDSPLQVATFLACIAVGAIPAIINPCLPTDQIKQLIADYDAHLFVFENRCAAEAHALLQRGKSLCLAAPDSAPGVESLNEWIAKGDQDWQGYAHFAGDQPCYLQFTSGSTGKAKGVMHTFDNTVASCQKFAVEHLHIGPNDLLYSVPKIFFGYGMGNSVFFPLYTGAAAILSNDWPKPEAVCCNLSRFRPTVLFAVPSMYRALREEARLVARTVRLAISAGSSLPAAEFLYWREFGVEICDGIGATEVCHIFLGHEPGHARPGSTGKPLRGFDCKLVDDQGLPITDLNSTGVLQVKGPSVAKGYWGEQDETSMRFNRGWYRTGDLFSVDGDGFYCHHGREDDQFKVNGRKVTPILVEKTVCEAFPSVTEAVLVPSTSEHDALAPTLFVTAAGADAGSVGKQIEDWAKVHFPSYVRPRKVISIDSMPRNPNGKLIRSALTHQAQQGLGVEG